MSKVSLEEMKVFILKELSDVSREDLAIMEPSQVEGIYMELKNTPQIQIEDQKNGQNNLKTVQDKNKEEQQKNISFFMDNKPQQHHKVQNQEQKVKIAKATQKKPGQKWKPSCLEKEHKQDERYKIRREPFPQSPQQMLIKVCRVYPKQMESYIKGLKPLEIAELFRDILSHDSAKVKKLNKQKTFYNPSFVGALNFNIEIVKQSPSEVELQQIMVSLIEEKQLAEKQKQEKEKLLKEKQQKEKRQKEKQEMIQEEKKKLQNQMMELQRLRNAQEMQNNNENLMQNQNIFQQPSENIQKQLNDEKPISHVNIETKNVFERQEDIISEQMESQHSLQLDSLQLPEKQNQDQQKKQIGIQTDQQQIKLLKKQKKRIITTIVEKVEQIQEPIKPCKKCRILYKKQRKLGLKNDQGILQLVQSFEQSCGDPQNKLKSLNLLYKLQNLTANMEKIYKTKYTSSDSDEIIS